ncbi:chemotaxis protein CheW [uncultured Thiodictyon sp.]|uniref:chemotaxis protein CheW n=1 Tax=uncultured Thiodictyon sp. TaxID=1846217 RepID=UPI0025DE8E90|nr:chemotaxis protein CheW [uncultured Thiodictyon sp.]
MSDPTELAPCAAPLPAAELEHWTKRYAQTVDPLGDLTGSVFVIVRVAGERFALPMQALDEVASVTTGIALPHVSALVLGLANVRGELVPLLNTGALLGINSSYRLGAANRTLVVRDARSRRAGLPVDAVESVVALDADSFQAQGGVATNAPIRRIGVGEHKGRSLTLLDVSPLLAAGFNHF